MIWRRKPWRNRAARKLPCSARAGQQRRPVCPRRSLATAGAVGSPKAVWPGRGASPSGGRVEKGRRRRRGDGRRRLGDSRGCRATGSPPRPDPLRNPVPRAFRARAPTPLASLTDRDNPAYAADWKTFASWLRRQGLSETPPDPEAVGLYLAAQVERGGAELAVATLERRLSGIAWRYRQLGQPLDLRDRHIATVLAGIRRRHARPPLQKAAVFADELLAMLATLDMDLRGLRDRAILAIGFAGGLRRSEVVGLDCGPDQTEDGSGWIEILPGGALLTLRGKTGWREVEIGRGSRAETCPVALLETWLRLGRNAGWPSAAIRCAPGSPPPPKSKRRMSKSTSVTPAPK